MSARGSTGDFNRRLTQIDADFGKRTMMHEEIESADFAPRIKDWPYFNLEIGLSALKFHFNL